MVYGKSQIHLREIRIAMSREFGKLIVTVAALVVAAELVACGAASGRVATYRQTPGAVQSGLFSVTANGREVFVEKFRTVHYARLACSGPADVTIKASEAVMSCKVSPDRYNITPTISGNSISFRLPGFHCHLFIEINDLEHFMLFPDPIESDKPKLTAPEVANIMDFGVDSTGSSVETAKIQEAINSVLSDSAKNILYFPPGVYKTGYIVIKGDMKIYLEDGALIKGTGNITDYLPDWPERSQIFVRDSVAFELYGRGVIDGEGVAMAERFNTYHSKAVTLLATFNCSNTRIRDVLLRNASNWCCSLIDTDNALVSNVKILQVPHHFWMDGFDATSCESITFRNCFTYSHDDCFAIMAHEKDPKRNTRPARNIKIEDCAGWTLCSGVRMGWNSGAEITGIHFKNVDFLYCRTQGIAIHQLKNNANYGDMTFENCNWERANGSKLFCSIEGPNLEPNGSFGADLLEFINCTVDGLPQEKSTIRGSADYGIKRLVFDNFTIAGTRVKKQQDLEDNKVYWTGVREASVKGTEP